MNRGVRAPLSHANSSFRRRHMIVRLIHKWKTVRQLPIEFWDALGDVYDHYLMLESSYRNGIHARGECGDLHESFATLQKWLYTARESGWCHGPGNPAIQEMLDE